MALESKSELREFLKTEGLNKESEHKNIFTIAQKKENWRLSILLTVYSGFLSTQTLYNVFLVSKEQYLLSKNTQVWRIQIHYNQEKKFLEIPNKNPAFLSWPVIYRCFKTYSQLPISNTDYFPPYNATVFQKSIEGDFTIDYLYKAAAVGNIELVQWLVSVDRGEQKIFADKATLDFAARSGNLALVKWLVSEDRDYEQLIADQKTLDDAVKSGNSVLVKWLMSPAREARRLNSCGQMVQSAFNLGNQNLANWLLNEALLRVPEKLFVLSRKRRYINRKLFSDPILAGDKRSLYAAARGGMQEKIEWLISPDRGLKRLFLDQKTLHKAVKSNNRELIAWLMSFDRGFQQLVADQDTLEIAFKSGDLSLVTFLKFLNECFLSADPEKNVSGPNELLRTPPLYSVSLELQSEPVGSSANEPERFIHGTSTADRARSPVESGISPGGIRSPGNLGIFLLASPKRALSGALERSLLKKRRLDFGSP